MTRKECIYTHHVLIVSLVICEQQITTPRALPNDESLEILGGYDMPTCKHTNLPLLQEGEQLDLKVSDLNTAPSKYFTSMKMRHQRDTYRRHCSPREYDTSRSIHNFFEVMTRIQQLVLQHYILVSLVPA